MNIITLFSRSRTTIVALVAILGVGLSPLAVAQDTPNGADNFYISDNVVVQKVKFVNQYNMQVVGNLFAPKNMDNNIQHPAIIVGHPIGAVKEQAANLYATKMAEQGFVTLSLDLSFWGESEGQPRNAILPDVYTDDFSAAVDFLSTQSFVDPKRIGVIGICASGGFTISAAKIDPRLKAVVTISMYDMGAASRNGLKQSQSLEQRQQILQQAAQQRYAEYMGGQIKYIPGTINKLTENSMPIEREFYDFYRTKRGAFIPEGMTLERTTQPVFSSSVKFMNFYPFNDIETISPRPMLFIAGENAHSIEFSEDAYRRAAEPKELYLVPNAGHVDLYDRVNLIPFDKITSFFKTSLK